jgi:ATP-binding cassette, subfamily B, bacterial PglK
MTIIKYLLFFTKTIDDKILSKFLKLNMFFILNAVFQMLFILSFYYLVKSFNKDNSLFLDKNIIFFFDYLSLEKKNSTFIYLFLFFGVCSNTISIISNYIKSKFSTEFLTKSRSYFYQNYLNFNYLNLYKENLDKYVNRIITQCDRSSVILLDSFNNIIQNFFLIICIIIPSLIINPKITIISISFLGFIFISISILFKKRIKFFGSNTSSYTAERINLINILFDNLNEIKINLTKDFFNKIFFSNEKESNRIYKNMSVLSHSLKPMFEIILIIIFSVIIIFFVKENMNIFSISDLIILSLVTLYRLLPSTNVVYQSLNEINFNTSALKELTEEIKKFDFKNEELVVDKKLIDKEIKSVEFEKIHISIKEKQIIKNFNRNFVKNRIYGIHGESGSGKTTFLNIFSGLIKPNSGKILVNGISNHLYENIEWYKNISLMPQKVNLLRASIYKNIAFEYDDNKINKNKIDIICERLNLNKRFNNLEEKLTFASGGELQRISIARSIYKNSQILLFDEPSNNLDEKNTNDFYYILDGIKKDKIIIVSSHDKNFINKCDQIINF